MTTLSTPPNLLQTWQDVKRARSGDRFWILTNTQSHFSRMHGCSPNQQWFRVGAVDLTTMKLGYFDLSIDDIRSLLKAQVPAAPWKHALPMGIELTRIYHGPKKEGRFRERVTLIDLDPELVAQGPSLRAYFERGLHFGGNSSPGMWLNIEKRAAELRAIETAALSLTNWFTAGDVKQVLGKDVNVSPSLALLVDEGRLLSNGKKTRAAKYMVAPVQLSERADWTG